MARTWTPWPRSTLDRLQALIEQGLTYQQVAEDLGRSVTECKGAAQRIGLTCPERRSWRRRDDWAEIDRILVDCLESRLMTVPQARDHLAALGHRLGLSTLYKRLGTLPRSLQERARRNGQSRRAACCTRMRHRQVAQRNHRRTA